MWQCLYVLLVEKCNGYTFYPCYICQNHKCEYKGKSIRRELLEGEFETLLKSLTPSAGLMATAERMFKKCWAQREATRQLRQESLQKDSQSIQRKMDQLLDRIVEAQSPTVITAFEKKIKSLEDQRRVLEERMATIDQPVQSYDTMY